jgi:1-acyl-sn-glycerol-3-phosphate acyltransferase
VTAGDANSASPRLDRGAKTSRGGRRLGAPVKPGQSNTRSPLARRSPAAWAFMGAYFERFFRKHMNGLRLARWGAPDLAAGGPVVVYSNHPAWWDGAVYVLLGHKLFRDLECYAPIDAAMLEKYGFFARIGAFGLDLDSPRGAASFLRTGAEILSRPDRGLWVTAQGRFSDPRERPVGLRAGVARLAEHAPPGTRFVPLAIEYAFWTERGAEALVAFGPAVGVGELLDLPRPERLARLEADLAATMDRLAADAVARDPARFVSLLEGKAGIGGVYDAWRRARAALRGERFDPAHRQREPAA